MGAKPKPSSIESTAFEKIELIENCMFNIAFSIVTRFIFPLLVLA